MIHRECRSVALLACLAGGCGDTPPSCETAVRKAARTVDGVSDSEIAAMVASCIEERWTERVRTCLGKASGERAIQSCITGREAPEARFRESPEEVAQALVRKLAFESYALWVSRPANAGKCPTARELAELGGSATDPWGNELVVRCTDLPPSARGFGVSSNGRDGQAGTADDVRSWQ